MNGLQTIIGELRGARHELENSNNASTLRFVESAPLLIAIAQREACQLGLILQTNGKQTLMCEKLLRGFIPVRSSYKTLSDCLQRKSDHTPEAA